MNEKQIIRQCMAQRGFNQTMLAEAAGFARQSNISELLRSKNLRVDNMLRLLNAMGYDVIVKDRNAKSKMQWTIELGEQ